MKYFNHFKALLVLGILGLVSSCSTTTQTSIRYDGTVTPFYTGVEKAINLRAGMNKEEARQTLGVYPFDILHNQFDGCEIHHYLYTYALRELPQDEAEKNLNTGIRKESGQSDLFLVFRDGSLETFFSKNGKEAKSLLEFKEHAKFVCNNPDFLENKRGCTDPEALNYDSEATIDDGSARYCPCGFVKNPWYNAVRPCGDKECISEEEFDRRRCQELCDAGKQCDCGKGGKKVSVISEKEECDLCEIIDKAIASPNGNVEIKMNISPNDLKSTVITTEGRVSTAADRIENIQAPEEKKNDFKGLLNSTGKGGKLKIDGKPTSSNTLKEESKINEPLDLGPSVASEYSERWMKISKKRLKTGVPLFVTGAVALTAGGIMMAVAEQPVSVIGAVTAIVGLPLFVSGIALLGSSARAKRKASGKSLALNSYIENIPEFEGGLAFSRPTVGLQICMNF